MHGLLHGIARNTARQAGRFQVLSVERVTPVTVLISPKEGLQATGHGMTYRPCYP